MRGDNAAVAHTLRSAFARTLAAVDLRARVRVALAAPPGGRVTVVAMGKSAAPMLAGALDVWDPWIDRAVLCRPARALPLSAMSDGVSGLVSGRERVTEYAGGHPLPDAVSVAAGDAVVGLVTGLTRADTVLVLLSGGASAAVCTPRPGVTLGALRSATEAMLSGGAAIEAVNGVRGRMETLKQGGLRTLAAPARVLTLASMDVLGDPLTALQTLGGAPTVATHQDAMEVVVIAQPGDVREAMAAALIAQGHRVTRGDDVRGNIDSLVMDYALRLRALERGEAWVAVGEPTVVLPLVHGRGGRAGRLALGVAQAVKGVDGVAFLAAGTDGVDGGSDAAGAVVTGETWGLDEARAQAAVENWDDGTFHGGTGTAVAPGPTGINLLDVHAMVRE